MGGEKQTLVMRTTMNKPITPQQLKALHATFHKLGMDDDARHECIASFTSGRTASSKHLTMTEARLLLSRLNQDDEQVRRMMLTEARTLCRSIYFLASQISFLNKDYPTDTQEDFEMNKAKIDVWARKYSRFHKNVNQMNVAELKEVKEQLEAIARKEKTRQIKE